MREALLLLAISVVLVPASIAQSMDVSQRQSQNQLLCGPSFVTSPGKSHVQRFGPNNSHDLVGYLEFNVYNCAGATLNHSRLTPADQPVRRKRRSY